MKKAVYDIHGLLQIYVEGNETLLTSIDQHLFTFKTQKEFENYNVVIRPYSSFKKSSTGESVDDWIFSGNFAIRPSRKLAFDINSESISLFSDRLELPINLLVQLALLKVNCTFVHSAGIQFKGKGILLPAAPGVGKTTTIAVLLRNSCKMLGDDLCILGEGKLWAYPQSLSIYPYHAEVLPRLQFRVRSKLNMIRYLNNLASHLFTGKNIFSRGLRFISSFVVPQCLSINPEEVFGSTSLVQKVELSAIVNLRRDMNYEEIYLESSRTQILQGAVKILWHEWHSNFHELLLVDALLYGPNWIEGLIHETEKVVLESTKNVNHFSLTIPSSWSASDLSKNERGLLKALDQIN